MSTHRSHSPEGTQRPLGAQRNRKIWVIGEAESGVASQNVVLFGSSESIRTMNAWNLHPPLSMSRYGVNLGVDGRATRTFALLCNRGPVRSQATTGEAAGTKMGESAGCTGVEPEVYTIPGQRHEFL